MGDAQLIAAQGGATIGLTQSRAWNGIWLARVRRNDQGWTVEVEIPFRTLNFDPGSGNGARTFSAPCGARTKTISGADGLATRDSSA